ncbi:hypothetical protein ASPVEDRAFT_569313 [Aspergillus versicolor CBS 583.65]|uniref:Uncharacterized protein n=1 Tax=Aspergillus versicolor CBS 583.65 TaxID=1036611 RepID=A0A1L9PG77_ASPVE|nr:uncharacterized protein ASPVEDRAFT_569313 [Aspergillus versicolor CBS 583.65]OJJ00456.1 hypothetical protein ASPVEDRAFT_569313 [Aspergillus versicolor CBS 583.65]
MALRGPRCCTAVVARPIVVPTVVAAATALLPRGHISCGRRAFPGFHISVVVAVGATFNPAHGVNSITAANSSTATVEVAIVAPIAASLAVRAITSHMASISTDATNDIGSKVSLFGTVVLSVADLTTYSMLARVQMGENNALTVLASLVLIITKSTVESSQLTKLVPLELVLTFGDRGSLHQPLVKIFEYRIRECLPSQ